MTAEFIRMGRQAGAKQRHNSYIAIVYGNSMENTIGNPTVYYQSSSITAFPLKKPP